MSKHVNEALAHFSQHLAKLRKAAGYTQQELADEIGATRRQIAYYETESAANLLVELAQALNVTADELLGLEPIKAAPKASSRLERRLKQIEKLGPKPRKQIIQLIDTFIEAEQLKRNVNA